MPNRTLETGAIWADGAPDVPGVPIQDTTYADSGLSPAEIVAAWQFSKIVDSATHNEMLRRLTTLMILIEQNGIMPYSALTNYPIGGQAMGSDGVTYIAEVVNGPATATKDPVIDGAPTWVKFGFTGDQITALFSSEIFSTGDLKGTIKTVADPGWVLANDGTIGSGASAATNRANDDTEALFTLLWNNLPDAVAPVTTGRGASAAADWAADKIIQVGTILGRVMGIAGTGSGLTARTLGEITGEETHQLTEAELAAHTHTTDDPGDHTHGYTYGTQQDVGDQALVEADLSTTFTNQTDGDGAHTHTALSTGGDTAHNNMQPTFFVNLMMKL